MDDPEDDITAARCRQLNERFYRANPASYFRTRMLTLVTLAGNPEGVLELLRQGVEYAGVRIRLGDESTVDSEELSRHVTMESQILLHHSAEAVIRLFLAHVDRLPCPWIVLSGDNNFRQFKEKVQRTLVDLPAPKLNEHVGRVFLGAANPGDEDDKRDWHEASRNTAAFLQEFAGQWLRDAHIYNAIKHGLAAATGAALFELLPESGAPIRLGEGTSLDYLEVTSWESDQRTWQLSTTWVDVAESLGLVQVAAQMIDSLWLIARHRYVDGPAAGSIFYPVGLKPADLRSSSRPPARTMSQALMEERRVTT